MAVSMRVDLYLCAGLKSSWNVICLWIWKETQQQKTNLVMAVLRSAVCVIIIIKAVAINFF